MPASFNGSWVIEMLDEGTAAVGFETSIAVDSLGQPHIAYGDNTNDTVKYAYWNGSAWQIQTIAYSSIKTNLHPSLALDSVDQPHISYVGPPKKLKYTHWNGSTWQTTTVESNNASGPVSLVLDADNKPHIGYSNFDTEVLKYAFWDGSGWQIQQFADNVTAIWEASMALDSARRPHFAYRASTGDSAYSEYEVRYAVWDGQKWQAQTVEGPTPRASIGNDVVIALDASDNPHIAYYNGVTNSLSHAYWDGSVWVTESVDSAGPPAYSGLYTGIAIDAWGRTHISYHYGGSELRYALRDSNGWHVETLDSGETKGQHTSIALNNTGYPNVSYSYWSYTDNTRHLLRAYVPAPQDYSLTMAVSGNGIITPSVGTYTHVAGTIVNINAVPATGWRFVNWSGGVASPASANTTVVMDGDKTMTASFAPVVAGDANEDGQVNAVDVTLIERIVAGMDPATPGADANQDGKVNALDVTKVERVIAGLD